MPTGLVMDILGKDEQFRNKRRYEYAIHLKKKYPNLDNITINRITERKTR